MFISPLTLLIVPLLGSLIILTYSNGISKTLNLSLNPQNIENLSEAAGGPTGQRKVENNFSLSSSLFFKTNGETDGIGTLINKSHLTIKSIALITSFLNLVISIIM